MELGAHSSRPPSACSWAGWQGKQWAAVAELGRVAWDKYRGWHIDFRAVDWPGCEKPRRVRIAKTDQGGRFVSREAAQQCLTLIRERAMNRPLHEILSGYMEEPPAEQCVPARWAADFIAAKRVAQERGEITQHRLYELERYPARGYLAFWEGCPVGKVDGPAVAKWYEWLRATHPQLSAPSIRHVVTDFRTFLGHLRRVGALEIIPEMPRVRVPRKARVVPDAESLARVLERIPEPERGLWLARTYAGLRPAESRRVDVRDYARGVLTIRAEVSKTGEPRYLAIAHVAPVLAAWIERHRAQAGPWEPLFPAPRSRDGRWRNTPERRVWLEALAAAGLEHVAPNLAGRHAFATHEALAQTDLRALQEWLGHASLRTTEIYMHADAATLARRMRPIAQRRNKSTYTA